MSIQRLRAFLKSLVLKERSPKKLALSFCVAVYIAISPFIGFHTLMAISLSALLGLNFAVTFCVQAFINNPWTMVPIYTFDYLVGDWLLQDILGWRMLDFNPGWMGYVNRFVTKHIPIADISLWSFLIGGNLLAIVISVALYPIMKRFFIAVSLSLHKDRDAGT